MFQTTLTSNDINILCCQAQQTLKLFERSKEQILLEHFEKHKHFRKGDKKGWFSKHEADQTFDQYRQEELERRYGKTWFGSPRTHDREWFNKQHYLYEQEFYSLKTLIQVFEAAKELNLEQIVVDVTTLAAITKRPPCKTREKVTFRPEAK
jgi:hypothetical protein